MSELAYYELFDKTLRILSTDGEGYSEPIEKDCWSYSADCHYTETVGVAHSIESDIIGRVLVRVDEDARSDYEDIDFTAPDWLDELLKDMVCGGHGDYCEAIHDILASDGWLEIRFESFGLLKVRKLADEHYLVQFTVTLVSDEKEEEEPDYDEPDDYYDDYDGPY